MSYPPPDVEAIAAGAVEVLSRLGPLTVSEIRLELRLTSEHWLKKVLAGLEQEGRVVASVEELIRPHRKACDTGWSQRRYRATVYRLTPSKRARRARK